MKASDYIVEYIINRGITDVFGYPGGMVTHLIDSFARYKDQITAHVVCHEQGAAFAACGYAQVSGKPGIAYATSGPGATNLITGIANAYYDSVPTVFITGQVNTNESKARYKVRQRGFQETDIVSIVKPITKYAKYIEDASTLPVCLDQAFSEATTGRKGPVLLDIPMNVLKADIPFRPHAKKIKDTNHLENNHIVKVLEDALYAAKNPCVLIGNGVKASNCANEVREFVERLGIPVVSSMISFDVLPECSNYYGFIGAYGSRAANFIVAKSDLIISFGSRLDIRQIGIHRESFAPGAKIIRFDIDDGELEYKAHIDEIQFQIDLSAIASDLVRVNPGKDYAKWRTICNRIRELLQNVDDSPIAALMNRISMSLPNNCIVTTDVGQNQVWVAQYCSVKYGQRFLFSGGHGAMGYALPSAIGACFAYDKRTVVCITGDGGMQMNIQELQLIAREQIPIKIIVLNNHALGMIRHFQEIYFDKKYFQTNEAGGYSAPDFSKIGAAYGIRSVRADADSILDVDELFVDMKPALLEIDIIGDTYISPKLEFGRPNQDQSPRIDRNLFEYIMNL